MALRQSLFFNALYAGLLLFGLTLPISKSAGNVILFLVYIVVAAGVLLDKDIRDTIVSSMGQPLTLAFFLYFLVAFIGVFYTENYSDGFHISNKFLSLPAVYLMAAVLIQTIRDEEKRHEYAENILFAFLAGLIVLNGIGLMTYFGIIGHKKFVLPLSPLNVHHIWFSNLNALGMYAAVSLSLFSRRGKSMHAKWLLMVYLLLAASCVILSTSRAAWLGILMTSGIVAVLSFRREAMQNKKRVVIALAVVAVACVALYTFVPIVQERIGLIGSDIVSFSAGKGDATSLGARFLMWKAALKMFLANPLAGVGTGDYGSMMASYIKAGQFPEFLLDFNQPHNMYLFALATNGLLGLGPLLYLFYRTLGFAIPRLTGDERERLFAFLAAATALHFMIAGFTDSFFNIQILRYGFAFILGVCVRK